MSSIFDLKTSASQLPSVNQGAAELQYQQITSSVPVEGTQFPNSQKKFRFDLSSNTYWIPSKSYIRTRLEYRKPNDAQLDLADNVAPNMNLINDMFQQSEFLISNKTVSKLEDNVPQITILDTRLTRSKAWMDSVGNGTNLLQPDFVDRQALITSDYVAALPIDFTNYVKEAIQGQNGTNNLTQLSITAVGLMTFSAGGNTNAYFVVGDLIKLVDDNKDNFRGNVYRITAVNADRTMSVVNLYGGPIEAQGNAQLDAQPWAGMQKYTAPVQAPTPGVIKLEVCAIPNLSIFKIDSALPVGQYELRLTPQTTELYQKAAIESFGASKAPGVDFKVTIVDMYLYICTIKSTRVDNMTYYLSLDEINLQPIALDANGAGSITKKQFDVSPSTYGLTVAFQSQNIVNDTTKSASKFKFTSGTCDETKLSSLMIQYNNMSFPSPYADPVYTADTDYMTQRFIENQIQNGSFFDNSGSESKEDWIARGPYYYFLTPKDGASESTRVYVNFAFSQPYASNSANLLLFSHYKKTIAVTITEGRVSNVIEQDA